MNFGKNKTYFLSPFNRREMFTCTKPITGHIEGLHLHLEGVDGQILGHIESLLLTAHVRVAQGAPQVVQASVTGRDRFCHREGNKIDQKGLFNQKESEHDTANMRMEKTQVSVTARQTTVVQSVRLTQSLTGLH